MAGYRFPLSLKILTGLHGADSDGFNRFKGSPFVLKCTLYTRFNRFKGKVPWPQLITF